MKKKRRRRSERILTEYLNCPLALHVSDPLPFHTDHTPSSNRFFKILVGHNVLGKIIHTWKSSQNWSYHLTKFKVTKLFSKTHHILRRPVGENKWECEQHHHPASFEPFTVGLTSAIPSICTVCFQLNILTGRTSSEVSTYLPTIITLTSWIKGHCRDSGGCKYAHSKYTFRNWRNIHRMVDLMDTWGLKLKT